jgi:hypothetical protein
VRQEVPKPVQIVQAVQALRSVQNVQSRTSEAKKRFGLSVLNYVVTSNHIHLSYRQFQSFQSFNRCAPFKPFDDSA